MHGLVAMKRATKLVILGSVLAAAGILAVVLFRRRAYDRPRRVATGSVDLGRPIEPYDPGAELAEEATVIATSSGIASVDPQPLAQTAGEGIALDPVASAHTEVGEQRERLPRPSKGT